MQHLVLKGRIQVKVKNGTKIRNKPQNSKSLQFEYKRKVNVEIFNKNAR